MRAFLLALYLWGRGSRPLCCPTGPTECAVQCRKLCALPLSQLQIEGVIEGQFMGSCQVQGRLKVGFLIRPRKCVRNRTRYGVPRRIFPEQGGQNLLGALEDAAKTPGIPISPGELLAARINPRIPRVCVVPDIGLNMLCSSEFEVMRVKSRTDTYMLAYLLQTKAVQS